MNEQIYLDFKNAIYYENLSKIRELDSLYHNYLVRHEFGMSETSRTSNPFFISEPTAVNFLVFSAKCKKLKSLNLLLDLGYRNFYCEASNVLLELSLHDHDLELLKKILDMGHNPDGDMIHNGFPLFNYSYLGKSKYVKMLLDYGANPNKSNRFKFTALMNCCASNMFNLDTFLILINAGADPCLRDIDNESIVDASRRSYVARNYTEKFKYIVNNRLSKDEILQLFNVRIEPIDENKKVEFEIRYNLIPYILKGKNNSFVFHTEKLQPHVENSLELLETLISNGKKVEAIAQITKILVDQFNFTLLLATVELLHKIQQDEYALEILIIIKDMLPKKNIGFFEKIKINSMIKKCEYLLNEI